LITVRKGQHHEQFDITIVLFRKVTSSSPIRLNEFVVHSLFVTCTLFVTHVKYIK